jgi:hypothetical protein
MPVVHMDTGDRTWKNAPHAPLPGDQYYIGDCYERAPLSQDWELDTYVPLILLLNCYQVYR